MPTNFFIGPRIMSNVSFPNKSIGLTGFSSFADDALMIQNIIKKSEKKIDKYYTIYSYHKFVDLAKSNKIKLRNTLLIIDEVQNMISETGSFHKNLKKTIDNSDDKTRVILLSATPMFDKPVEISMTLNLLKPDKE